MSEIILSFSKEKIPDKPKVYTFGFNKKTVESLEQLAKTANRYSISGPLFKNGHRANGNIVSGSNIILIDCDETGQAEAVESKIRHYDYVKVPSASNSVEKPYKWHYVLPTQKPLSIYPAAYRWQVEEFFRQIGITDNMIDVTGSYDIARQFAPASVVMNIEEADDLVEINDTGLCIPVGEPDEVLCKPGAKTISPKIKGKQVSSLPSDHLWFKGDAITYTDAIKAVKAEPGNIVSGFGCPHNNINHRGDITVGYGFAYTGNYGEVIVKCSGNSCKDNKYFEIPEPSNEVDEEIIEIDMEEHPVHPITFQEKLSEKLLELQPKFIISKKMIDVFRGYASIFNMANNDNRNGSVAKRHIVPLATGSAKTTAMKLYAATTDEPCVIVVRRAMTAVEIARDINEWAKDTPARCYYSVDANNDRPDTLERVDKEDLQNHRVIVLTHNMFHRLSQTTPSSPTHILFGTNPLEEFDNYREENRNTVVIDERIDLIQQEDFTNSEISEAIEKIRSVLINNDALKLAVDQLEELNDVVFTHHKERANGSNKFGLYSKEKLSLIKERLEIFDIIIDSLQSRSITITKKSAIRGIKPRESDSYGEESAIIGLMKRAKFVCENNLMLTKQGKFTTISAVKDLSLVFGSVVVLDATANINETYLSYLHHQPDSTMMFERQQIRSYKETTFHIAEGIAQSKYKLYSTLTNEKFRIQANKVKVNAYLSVLYEVVEPEDNMLVVVHKDVLNLFTELNQHSNITFINWGNHAGSNAWSYYNKATIIGWFRTPQHVQASQLFAGADGYHNYEPTRSYDADVKSLENSSIVEDMVQFFNRIRCRIPIDAEGNHDPVDLYLFCSNSAGDKKIVKNMMEEFPGATSQKWIVKAGSITDTKVKKKTKVTERSDRIISELKMMSEKFEDVMAETIRNKLSITKSAFSRNVGSDYFKDLLNQNSIVYEVAKGSHGSQRKFTFK